MSFDAMSRILAEKTDHELTSHILAQVTDLEKNTEAPDRDKVFAELEYSAERWKASAREVYQEELEGLREKYRRDQDRRANQDLTEMRRTEARVNAMSDAELWQRAENFAVDPDVQLTEYESDLIAGRLRNHKNADALMPSFREALEAKRTRQPWTHDGEGKVLADSLREIALLKTGQIPVNNDGVTQQVSVRHLIDFDGELDKE